MDEIIKPDWMDEYMWGHFHAWMEGTVCIRHQAEVAQGIINLMAQDPEYYKGDVSLSWPNLRNLAELNAVN